MTDRPPAALLFDLDGTLTDTDKLHFQAYIDLLGGYERVIDLAYYRRHIMGAPNDRIMAGLFPELDVATHRRLAEEKERLFRASAVRMTPTEGLIELLDWADDNKIPKAVVTNAPRDNAELMLHALGLTERFPVLVIGDELAHGKPHPLPYLTALERLGAGADGAVAFEDSRSGVASAVAAGIATIGMLTGLDEATLRAAGAMGVARDFADPWLRRRIAYT
jgi:HAD superfamily hydrolase (TIGR01509 family)